MDLSTFFLLTISLENVLHLLFSSEVLPQTTAVILQMVTACKGPNENESAIQALFRLFVVDFFNNEVGTDVQVEGLGDIIDKWVKDHLGTELQDVLKSWLKEKSESITLLDNPYEVAHYILSILEDFNDICSLFSLILHYQQRAPSADPACLAYVPFSNLNPDVKVRDLENARIFTKFEGLLTINVTAMVAELLQSVDFERKISIFKTIVQLFSSENCTKITKITSIVSAIIAFLTQLNIVEADSETETNLTDLLVKEFGTGLTRHDWNKSSQTVKFSSFVAENTLIGLPPNQLLCRPPMTKDQMYRYLAANSCLPSFITEPSLKFEQKRKRSSHDARGDHKSKK